MPFITMMTFKEILWQFLVFFLVPFRIWGLEPEPKLFHTQITGLLINSLILGRMEIKTNERMILGIDPGTVNMGYGLVMESNKKLKLETLGSLNLSAFDTHPDKLRRIFEYTLNLIEQYHPDCMAIEDPFYGKNIQVMLKLGRAQGVAMAAALSRDIPIFEYSPKKIKQSITGRGNASKEQVAAMLHQLLSFKQGDLLLDATDGLAVAVCHAFQGFTSGPSKKYTGWESFVKDNPKKMKVNKSPL